MSTWNSVHTYTYKIHLLQVFFSPWKQGSATTAPCASPHWSTAAPNQQGFFARSKELVVSSGDTIQHSSICSFV